MPGFWNAHSDLDWYAECGMQDEPEVEPDPDLEADEFEDAEAWRCVHGHDRCDQMYPGPDCPYCERVDPHPDPRADAIEDARRWLDRAAQCERLGYLRDHFMGQAVAALEGAGLTADDLEEAFVP